jgi:hypothetical protein
MSEPVDFYGGPFSNFARSPFRVGNPWKPGEDITYPTVEHFFQAMKATCEADHDAVLAEPDCWKAKAVGQKILLRDGWDDIRYDVMLAGLREKFKITYFRVELLRTGDAEIREDSPSDFIWGYRNNGLNLLGKALMEIRAEIVAEQG